VRYIHTIHQQKYTFYPKLSHLFTIFFLLFANITKKQTNSDIVLRIRFLYLPLCIQSKNLLITLSIMKLKNLFYLLLALPLFFAGCSDEPTQEPSNKPTEEYYMEKTLIYGASMVFNNNFMLTFNDTNNEILVIITLIGDEGDEVLKAGTYTATDNTISINSAAIMYNNQTNEDGSSVTTWFEGGDGTAVVEGDINNYKIDIVMTDAEQRSYHFTFDGKISGLSPDGELPTEPVNITAEEVDGYYICYESTSTHNYSVSIYEKPIQENGLAQADSSIYTLNVYSVKSEIDADGYAAIPVGTYSLYTPDSSTELYISPSGSGYTKINADGTGIYTTANYDDCQLVVTEDGLTLTATIGGVLHTVTYSGSTKITAKVVE
jgi:hypothetical protein